MLFKQFGIMVLERRAEAEEQKSKRTAIQIYINIHLVP
jgi:hypothetical protein